jgi:hypothetical protein
MVKDREARPRSAAAWRQRVSTRDGSGHRCGDKIVPSRVHGAERLVNHKTPTPPVFFLSVASKGFSDCVTRLESTVADGLVDVDSKELVRAILARHAVGLVGVAHKRLNL